MTTEERHPTSKNCIKLILQRSAELIQAYEGLKQVDSARTGIFVTTGASLRNQRAKEHNNEVKE